MINILNEKNCCGCKNCYNICPNNSIQFRKGMLGHIFPQVDTTTCIDCGKCESVCPMTEEIKPIDFNQIFFIAYSKDFDIRRSGSSGGMFRVFAEHLLNLGYEIYAAAFDDHLNLITANALNKEELFPLLKSKYLICDTGKKFSEIKAKLDSERKIMYVSTPCQVFALKKYLGKDYDNLITVDFFCHGVPSQEFFNKCIEFDQKNRYGGKKIKEYSFREKIKHGATPHYFSVIFENGEKQMGYYFDSTFYAAFQKYICLRESCYSCRFCGRNRPSDITIGDFHNVENYVGEINRFDGISSVVINSVNGLVLWNNCSDSVWHRSLDIENLIKERIIFSKNTERPEDTDEFIKEYENGGVDGIYDKYLKSSFYRKNRIYYSLPKPTRDIIKWFKGMF